MPDGLWTDLLGEDTRLARQLAFIAEIDRLKHVLRQTRLMDGSRRENDAEHSWHLAMMALVLAEHAPPGTDMARVVAMLLVHDLVEIDAGDTFLFDAAAVLDQAEREARAADRIFALLPHDQAQDMRALWEEFEARATAEARFARALDRLQPQMHNHQTDGGTWRRAAVTPEAARARSVAVIADGAPRLARFAESLVADGERRGYFDPSSAVTTEAGTAIPPASPGDAASWTPAAAHSPDASLTSSGAPLLP